MNILIVPDKFKGTLTAKTAAALIAKGWREARPGDSVELLPMSDGGDGFGEILASLSNMEARMTRTVDAAHRDLDARWWWSGSTRTAVIESAGIIGLALLPAGRHHPFEMDTTGLGAVFKAALERGAEKIIVGIGGSATNDGGFGLARALGWAFFDAAGHPITHWTNLKTLTTIRSPQGGRIECAITVAVDVRNPLLGPNGASRIYGPQKGLKPEDFPLAEACLGRLAEVAGRDLRLPNAASEPGTGAAGGLGFGLRCFFGARIESGFDLFARIARLREQIHASDLVITGEGSIDASTLMGKGVGEVAALCHADHVPCLGLAGALAPEAGVEHGGNKFTRVYGIVPQLTTPNDAMGNPALWLPRLAALAANEWTKSIAGGLPGSRPGRFGK
jgi:glycerate kinase